MLFHLCLVHLVLLVQVVLPLPALLEFLLVRTTWQLTLDWLELLRERGIYLETSFLPLILC